MALKGKPRDMNKWREVLLDPNVHFPGESSEYRRCFSPRRADQPRRDCKDKPRSARRLRTRTRLAQPTAAVLAEQQLQPRLPCGSTGGEQLPVLNVFSRDEDGIRHHWASEMTFKRGDTSSLDPLWALYGVLDLTREGRGDSAAYPNLQY
jgi:predicted dithiol-disulfide oxidoreductase (DUF899 family)